MIKAFILAPTPMLRAGLRALLSTEEIVVVGEAAAPDEEAFAPAVDVLVVDERLLEETALEAAAYQSLSLVVLAANERPVSTLRALVPRGWALVLPDAPGEELRAAVVAAAQGLVALPPRFAERLLAPNLPVENLSRETLEESLTGRESEVLQLLSEGLSNKLIARQLQISEHTVKFHISSIYAKLGASSRTEAVRRGAHLGLISY